MHTFNATHLDGSPLFILPGNKRAEDEVATEVEQAWGCELHRFAMLCPIDWYGTRAERLVGLLELKRRDYPTTQYPTAVFAVRKWLALMLASEGLGVPGILLVKFTDAIRWCRVADVDARRVGILRRRDARARADAEPMIHVPVEFLKPLVKGA